MPAPKEEDLSKGILEAIDMDSYRVEKKAVMKIALADADAEIEPVPTDAGGRKGEPELDRLSNILKMFNEQFGTLFTDADRVARRTLRAILRKQRLWANLQPDVKMLRARSDIGRALSRDEETRLLAACKASRSRSLYPAVLLSIHSGLRNQELRLLRWRQIDMLEHTLTVGKSKTAGGEGRTVPLSDTAWRCIQEWRSQWPEAHPEHYLFPSEKYGLAGEEGYLHGALVPYDVRPDAPMGSWKVAWTNAKQAAGVQCRWHDLRHTFVSRIAEGQVSDATIMALAGHMSVKMKEKYSHVRAESKRQAILTLDMPGTIQ
jgi:integrase